MLNHDYKINNGHNLQFTKFSFIDFVLIDRRSLSGKRPKSASGKSFDIVFFHACYYGFSQGRKSLYNTVVYVIKDNVKE